MSHANMPQFYETDSIQCWIHSCISEKYDSLEDGDSSEYLLRITECVKNLEQEAEEFLQLDYVGFESSLFRAVLNTIDFPELLVSLKEQYEDELAELNQLIAKKVEKELEVIYDKDKGIDKTDKAFSTAIHDYYDCPDPEECNKCEPPKHAKEMHAEWVKSRPDFFSIMSDREKARKESKKCDGCGGSETVAPTPSGKKLCDGCDSHFSTM